MMDLIGVACRTESDNSRSEATSAFWKDELRILFVCGRIEKFSKERSIRILRWTVFVTRM